MIESWLCVKLAERCLWFLRSVLRSHSRRWGGAKKRREIANDLDEQLAQLKRSEPYKDEVDALPRIVGLLARSAAGDYRRLTAALDRISRTATLIPLDAGIISSATSSPEASVLEPQDLMVYLSVTNHLAAAGGTDSCFISRDEHFFRNPDLRQTIEDLGCKMFQSFGNARQYLEHRCGSNSKA